MQIEWTAGAFEIRMDYYLEQLVKNSPNVVYCAAPGIKDTFKIDVGSPLLKDREHKLFHSAVAHILYLVKRIHTDALTITSFLCMKVTKVTDEDPCKLEQLLGYFKSSKGKKFYVRISARDMQTRAFIDAAFALHFDAKSHTCAVITVGDAVVYVSLQKQKCITRSPTEARPVGLTDKLDLVGLFHEFMAFLIGKQALVQIV